MSISLPVRSRAFVLILASLCMIAGALVFAGAPALAAAPEAPEMRLTFPVTAEGATVHGALNPGGPGEAGTYEFLYKASTTNACEGEGKAPVPQGMSVGAEGERVVESLTGLKPGTEYAVCLRLENATGEATASAPTTSTTIPAPNTDAPTLVTARTATLNGHLMLDATDSQYFFTYRAGGECSGEGAVVTPTGDAGTGSANVAETAPVTGLLPNTQYTVCFVTSNVTSGG